MEEMRGGSMREQHQKSGDKAENASRSVHFGCHSLEERRKSDLGCRREEEIEERSTIQESQTQNTVVTMHHKVVRSGQQGRAQSAHKHIPEKRSARRSEKRASEGKMKEEGGYRKALESDLLVGAFQYLQEGA